MEYSIKVYKQYFNFAASHFMVFEDGSREPLHGHNYRLMFNGQAPGLIDDMVFDFLNIKPIIREACDELDHKFLLPTENQHLKVEKRGKNFSLETPDGSQFSIPCQDTLALPITNVSAERLAMYFAYEIQRRVDRKFNFRFPRVEIEIEETPGQSAVYILEEEKN